MSSSNDPLIDAIRANDTMAFRAALTAETDVNRGGGLPLQTAAYMDNVLFMKELVMAGADIAHALNETEKARAAIPRKPRYIYIKRVGPLPNGEECVNKEDEPRWNFLTRAENRLKKHKDSLLDDTEIEIQRKILRELRELHAEISEALHPRPLKGKLPLDFGQRAP